MTRLQETEAQLLPTQEAQTLLRWPGDWPACSPSKHLHPPLRLALCSHKTTRIRPHLQRGKPGDRACHMSNTRPRISPVLG